ncbi:TPA: recombinase family protein [Clostridium perfringens]|uniref:recombinase family protein n=1 Tax=Clostridium perfringens TaxID=1502 RepID=UPI001A1F2030|nr:recombinase family protein [Clostridium perfringens]EGS5728218.1 recombinase family protein [Clostridium perfringens]MCX0392258.1 recombinase family protein [Clostridium perfringens]MDK0695199.1 recombinase family protein [Clostridium perfringens]HAT4301950.1 recombinase family protein [Clostridium perfringens]
MVYGYVRCSTDERKQNIERQVRDIKGLTNEKIDYIYKEFESGTKVDRVELNKLLKEVDEGDTIVATEVSRISRSTKQLCEIIELAKSKRLKLILGGFIVDCTRAIDPMTEGMLKMMAVFSEMERNMISQRVKSGIANARAKGKQIGRKETTVEDIPLIFIKHYPKLKQNEINKSEFARLTNLSRPTINKYIEILEGNKSNYLI